MESLTRECANLFEEKSKLATEFAKAREIHQKLVEKLTSDREASADESNKTLLQLAETRTEYDKKMQVLRDDFGKQIAALKEERDRLAKGQGTPTQLAAARQGPCRHPQAKGRPARKERD